MKKPLAQIWLTILFFALPSLTVAATIFNITTTDQIVHVEPGGTVIITYTVQNTSGINMTGMKYYPPAGTTRTGGTCGNSLANGASCTVQLTFHAPSTPGTILLGPMKVCGRNGQICSQSNAANQVRVIIEPSVVGTLTITINPSDSLQYQSLHVVNNSSLNAQITSVIVAPALTGFVKWCQSGDGTCFHQSTCPIGMNIPPAPAPGSSCDLWFQSLDGSNIPIGPQPSGAIEVDTNDGVQHNFMADYEMDLYAGGTFTTAGGVTVNNIARWDGTDWFALGTGTIGTDGSVRAFAVLNGDLYVGGGFTTAGGITVNRVARWNGVTYSALSGPSGTGTNGVINALAVLNDDLYVGGGVLFTTAGGVTVNRIARWDGSAWSALTGSSGTGTSGAVNALAVLNGDLYVGGSFVTAGGVTVNNITQWSGTDWFALAGGITPGTDAQVRALTTLDDVLYVGGDFQTVGGDTLVLFVARWDETNNWRNLGPGIAPGPDGEVFALTGSNGDTYVGGGFAAIESTVVVPADNIALWNGTTGWSALGSGLNGNVLALTALNGDIFAGGAFTMSGGDTVNFVARWDGAWHALGSGLTGTNCQAVFPASSLTLH